MPQIGPANFIIGNSAQCFKKKKNQKDISEREKSVKDWSKLAAGRRV